MRNTTEGFLPWWSTQYRHFTQGIIYVSKLNGSGSQYEADSRYFPSHIFNLNRCYSYFLVQEHKPHQKGTKITDTHSWEADFLPSFYSVLHTIMGYHITGFLWISVALWERRQCFSSTLKTRKTCGQIFTTSNFKANFPWQLYLKSLEIQNLPISNSKGGHQLLQKAQGSLF